MPSWGVTAVGPAIPLGSDDSDDYDYDVDLGDGNDTAMVTGSAYTLIHGGRGNDVLDGTNAAVFYGDDGNDRLRKARLGRPGAGKG
ncbi:hypothetical protein ACFYPC_27625 [Streptomyces sp. NPDC005808]|uniref:hypothetical protein n=1 Tax=Streptomyces sp. NPDC005808 TaxID=3364734 RepID=UPI0036B59C5E